VTEHDHGFSAQDDRLVRNNWERIERIADAIIVILRESRKEACAPWCVPQVFEAFLLSFSTFEQVALVHVLAARIVNQEELDRGLDAPTPPC
jgi:hypothetical protein